MPGIEILAPDLTEINSGFFKSPNFFLVFFSIRFNSSSIFSINPKVGEFWLFPNYLMHTVYPFYGNEERRSVSFNANIDKEIYNVFGR